MQVDQQMQRFNCDAIYSRLFQNRSNIIKRSILTNFLRFCDTTYLMHLAKLLTTEIFTKLTRLERGPEPDIGEKKRVHTSGSPEIDRVTVHKMIKMTRQEQDRTHANACKSAICVYVKKIMSAWPFNHDTFCPYDCPFCGSRQHGRHAHPRLIITFSINHARSVKADEISRRANIFSRSAIQISFLRYHFLTVSKKCLEITTYTRRQLISTARLWQTT